MTYLDLIRDADRKLDTGEITLGEYEELIEPLKREMQPERERGHWIEGGHRKFIDLANADRQYTELGYPHRTYINMSCSNCGMITIVDASIRYDFCPHCGADMKEVDK